MLAWFDTNRMLDPSTCVWVKLNYGSHFDWSPCIALHFFSFAECTEHTESLKKQLSAAAVSCFSLYGRLNAEGDNNYHLRKYYGAGCGVGGGAELLIYIPNFLHVR